MEYYDIKVKKDEISVNQHRSYGPIFLLGIGTCSSEKSWIRHWFERNWKINSRFLFQYVKEIHLTISTYLFPSFSRSINSFFGSRFITKNGILLNNEMDDFSVPGGEGGLEEARVRHNIFFTPAIFITRPIRHSDWTY